MQTGLAGKVVLITGATRNHGRASALAFAEEGAHLLLCTRQSWHCSKKPLTWRRRLV